MSTKELMPLFAGAVALGCLLNDLLEANYKIALWKFNTLIWIAVCIVDDKTIRILRDLLRIERLRA